MIDYRRAFKIACELLNGAMLYGVDAYKIFEIMMDKDGVVTNDSYEEYILEHLQELDHGQYAIKALEQEPKTEAVKTAIIQELKDHFIEPEDAGLTIKGEYWLAREVLAIIEETEPKTGHWIGIDEEPHEVWECDHCSFVIDGSGCIDPYDYRDTYKFCPNCGTKMIEPQESEDGMTERNCQFCKNEYERGWRDALSMALKEAHTIHFEEGTFQVVQVETLIGLGHVVDEPQERSE
jgi:hypothetical protein